MKQMIEAAKYMCDGCGIDFLVEASDEPPVGFYMNVSQIHDGGGDVAENVFACSEKCIHSAVMIALTERGRGD